MAVVLIEGFDHFNTTALAALKGWSTTTGGVTAFNFPSGRFGGQCWNSTGDGYAALIKALPSSLTTAIAGVAFNVSQSASTLGNILTLRNGSGTLVCQVQVKTGQPISVLNGSGTVIATGTTAVTLSTWYYVEVKCVVATSGSVALQLNGVSEIATTTGNFGTSAIDHICVGPQLNFLHAAVDDVYVCDTSGSTNNTFLGDVRVTTLAPTGAGAHTQWTPLSGTNWSNVDETNPDGDTTYNLDATPGDIDTYTYPAVDSTGTVFGVQTNLYARKDDAGVRQIAAVARQSSTDYVGATATLGSGYAYYSQLYDKDPSGSAWTAATLNGDEFGVKEIA